MRKLREVLRLKYDCQLTNRQIGAAAKTSASTVSYYTRAFMASGLCWPLEETLSDDELVQKLEPYCSQLKTKQIRKVLPDFAAMHQELKRKGITQQLLYEEYKSQHSDNAYSYSEYSRRYRQWKKRCKASLRQTYKAGEKCFVDYAGPKVTLYNSESGVTHEAVIFIGVLGASNYTYAEATLTRSIPDWLGSHQRMFEFFGGVPKMVIPDNEKAGVKSACYYDPELNPNYCAFAAHYQTTVLPTRPGRPRDKAKVETAVQIVERFILAKLRHHKFFSLEELNQAIAGLLTELNLAPFKKLPGTRHSQFESLDKPELKPLPQVPYEHAEIKRVQVRLDYHIEVDKHYYSVPHHLIGKTVEYRLTQRFLEVYYQGQRIASHARSSKMGAHTVVPEHMPEVHRKHQAWTPQTFLDWAKKKGDACFKIVTNIIQEQPNPECCYRVYLGFCNLQKHYEENQFMMACQYACSIEAYQYKSIRSILETKIYQCISTEAANDDANFTPTSHSHVRGSNYYQP